MIYAVVNRKGGTGKTTTTVNVAARIAQLRPTERVLIIDLDPQGHTAVALGVQGNGRCVGDFLADRKAFRDVVVSGSNAHMKRPNLFVIPATNRLQDTLAELNLTLGMQYFTHGDRYQGPLMANILAYRLNDWLGHFRYVFLDCPPSLGLLSNAVYDLADRVIVPVRMAYLDTAGAGQNIEDIYYAQDSGAEIRITAVVPTFYRPRERVTQFMLQQIQDSYPRSVISEPIPQSTVIEQSQASGQQTIFEFAPDSPPALAYDNLVERILHDDEVVA